MTDSAGVPWEGRRFEPNPSADDDGSADPRLIEAVRRFRAGELGAPQVVLAMHDARLLLPLVTVRGDEGIGAHGQLVDKTQELSIVTVAGPDGRSVLPVFSSVETMRVWDAAARPIPIAAPRVAIAAAAESTPLIVLDPGSPTEFAVRRPALESLATGIPWLPCYEDETVLEAFLAAAAPEAAVLAVTLAPGDPDARLTGPELVVRLALEEGLDRSRYDAVMARLRQRWSASDVIADRVDSMRVQVVTA